MECVICKKSFTIELSVCPACGTMQGDSVREELTTKSLPKLSYLCYEKSDEESEAIPKPAEMEMVFVSTESEKISNSFAANVFSITEVSKAMSEKSNPQIAAKPQINQPPKVQPKNENLVEFQSKNNVVPEWRLQLQNAVRERMQSRNGEQETGSSANSSNRVLRTHGNAALKIAPVEEELPVETAQTEEVEHENEMVRNALKRIKMSRQQFFVEEKPEVPTDDVDIQPEDKKEFPFQIASRQNSGELRRAKKNSIIAPTKPTLVSSMRSGKEDFDTNKLPLIPQQTQIVSSLQTRPAEEIETIVVEEKTEEKIEQKETVLTETFEEKIIIENKSLSESEIKRLVDKEAEEEFKKSQEVEDFAPFTLRFNAGIFDLLIGSFASLILLSPFMLLGTGEWFTFAGFFAFLAFTAIVMFVYLTAAVGMFGKSFGMRLFSLELIDIENEDYPSFHQAAVSSAVYLASMALFGLGFLTVPFNEEQRAVHDLVSNTLVVKEL